MICTESRDRTPLPPEIIQPEKRPWWEPLAVPALGMVVLLPTFLLGLGISRIIPTDILVSSPPPMSYPFIIAPTPVQHALEAK